ncbi:MAG: hypothetical protein ACLQBX_16920 [Candidatus Limnocylindrales bacterium]
MRRRETDASARPPITARGQWRALRPRPTGSVARLVRTLAVVVAVAALAATCEGSPAPATPAPATSVFEELEVQGGLTVNLTAGDPGCTDRNMIPYAIHAQVKLPANAAQVSDVYLFTWNDHAGWTRGAVAFESCRTEYTAGTLAAGRTIDEIDVSPYRAFGPGWSPALKAALTQALVQSAGNGG